MYENHFGLSMRPFPSVPRVDQYYPGAAIEAARHTLARCIDRAEGVGMVVGPSGTGKTLLCQMLAEQFKDSFAVVLLSSGRLSTRRALLQAVLFGLGRPYRGMDEGELRLAMVDHLTSGDGCPQGMVLLVDEAHTLPMRLLEEVRMITNVVAEGQPRARLVLTGNSTLDERLASPKLDSFNQRIVARCYLEPFNRDETQRYIHAQIGACGREGEPLIPLDACGAVYQATGGVPRLINQVCDHALLLACAEGREQVDRATIEEAWADLQQLPTPWNGDAGAETPGGSVVEFGRLDDEALQAEDADWSGGDQQPSVPMLRISPKPDEPVADPVDQVEQIQGALSDLECDFEPAGSIGPELELVFDDPDDPFAERFEEDESIVDRYEPPQTCRGKPAVPCGQESADRPLAPQPAAERSDEAELPDAACGQEQEPAEVVPAMSSSPAPAQSGGQAAPDTPRADPATEHSSTPSVLAEDELEAAERREAEPASDLEPSGDLEPAGSDDPEPAAGASDGLDAPSEWNAERETVPLRRGTPQEGANPENAVEPEEDPIIVVEEVYDDLDHVSPNPPPRARRMEYGQLFARLRRRG